MFLIGGLEVFYNVLFSHVTESTRNPGDLGIMGILGILVILVYFPGGAELRREKFYFGILPTRPGRAAVFNFKYNFYF